MNLQTSKHSYLSAKAVWDIAEEWCHELIIKERDTYLEPDYELAQFQLQFDFMECVDIAD